MYTCYLVMTIHADKVKSAVTCPGSRLSVLVSASQVHETAYEVRELIGAHVSILSCRRCVAIAAGTKPAKVVGETHGQLVCVRESSSLRTGPVRTGPNLRTSPVCLRVRFRTRSLRTA